MTYQEYTTVPAHKQAQWANEGTQLINTTASIKWSGKVPPPAIGTKVKATFNNLGTGTVTGYFVEGGWLGLLVQFDNPPDWFSKKNANKIGHVFGIEFNLV